MKRVVVTSIFLVLAACSLAVGEEIRLKGGATSIDTVIAPIRPAFEKASGIKINAVAVGSKVALTSLDKGEVDAASAAHTFDELIGVLEKEKVELKNRGNLQSVELHAPVKYSIILNKNNPVSKLSKEQLKAIFTGTAQNWKEFGGQDQQIIVVWCSLTPGTNAIFSKKILDGAAPIKDVIDVKSVGEIKATVASNAEGIGIVAETNLDSTIKQAESPEIKSSPIILITTGKPTAKVQKLVDFIRNEGKNIIPH